MFTLFIILISVALVYCQRCSMNCAQNGNYQNPNNKNSYIQCSNGNGILILCPLSGDGYNHLEFDGQNCRERYNCAQQNGMFAHQRRELYYRCANGVASIERCPLGQVFVGYAVCKPRFECPNLSGDFPNPSNKSEYYQCCFGEATLHYCPKGYEYEQGSKCVPTFQCPQSSGKYRNIRKETQYYLCRNGQPQLMTCPSRQIFDGLECVDKFDCPLPNGKFINRLDQTNRTYYICKDNNPVKMQCPGGYVFYGEDCVEPFRCPRSNGRFGHQTDRNKYYICENGIPYPHKCQPNWEFSDVKQECQKPFECPRASGKFIYPDNRTMFYHCENYLPQLKQCPLERYFDGTKCVKEDKPNEPVIRCPNRVTMIKHPTNPRRYYYCGADHIPREQECPIGLVFDVALLNCVRSQFSCPQPNGRFAHPYNERVYFLCKEDSATLVSCNENEKFDKYSGMCSSGTKPHNPEFRCPESDGMFSHPTNQSLFYYCRSGLPQLRFCGLNKTFDRNLQTCVYKSDPGFRCPVSNGYFAHPYDDRLYYVCHESVPYIRECHRNEKFDRNQLKCVDTSDNYRYRCPQPNGLFPYPSDTNLYYLCRDDVPQLVRCPSGQTFNTESQRCIGSGEFQCPEENGLFRHPTNQSRFYNCRNSYSELRECPERYIFEESIGQCISWSWPITFYCPLPNGLFINPQNNSQYYECCQGRPTLKSCQQNQIFNGRHCVSEIIYSCGDNGNTIPTHPQCYNGHRYRYTCPYQYGSELVYNGYRCVQPYRCPISQGKHIIKNAVHTHQYYRCVDGMPSLYTCSRGYAYDERRGCCVYDERQTNGYYGYRIDDRRVPKPVDQIETDRERVNNIDVIPGLVIQENRKDYPAPIKPVVVTTEKIPTLPQIEPVEIRPDDKQLEKIPENPSEPPRLNGRDKDNEDDEEDDGLDDDEEDYKEDEEEDDYKDPDSKFKRSFENWRLNTLI